MHFILIAPLPSRAWGSHYCSGQCRSRMSVPTESMANVKAMREHIWHICRSTQRPQWLMQYEQRGDQKDRRSEAQLCRVLCSFVRTSSVCLRENRSQWHGTASWHCDPCCCTRPLAWFNALLLPFWNSQFLNKRLTCSFVLGPTNYIAGCD
jgi:hypothetical protein